MKFDTYKKGFDGIKQVFPFLDYFLPNYDEALYLTGEREPGRQADALLKAGCGAVVVKLGKEGCFLAAGGTKKTIPPCPARRVDTSGAGDNFVAGFLTGPQQGLVFRGGRPLRKRHGRGEHPGNRFERGREELRAGRRTHEASQLFEIGTGGTSMLKNYADRYKVRLGLLPTRRSLNRPNLFNRDYAIAEKNKIEAYLKGSGGRLRKS